jgi:hypothetical protein
VSVVPTVTTGDRRDPDVKLVNMARRYRSAEQILAAPPPAPEGPTEEHGEVLRGLGITTVADPGDWKYAQRAAARVAPGPAGQVGRAEPLRRVPYARRAGCVVMTHLSAGGQFPRRSGLGV